jgi:hypothetical protein
LAYLCGAGLAAAAAAAALAPRVRSNVCELFRRRAEPFNA